MEVWQPFQTEEEDQLQLPVLGGEQGPEKTIHTGIFTHVLKICKTRIVKLQASQVKMEATTKGKAIYFFNVRRFFLLIIEILIEALNSESWV